MDGTYFFDAVGTVIELRSKVERVYATVGQRWGNQQSPDTVGARWRSAFAKHFGSSTLAYSQPIDEEGECQRWRKFCKRRSRLPIRPVYLRNCGPILPARKTGGCDRTRRSSSGVWTKRDCQLASPQTLISDWWGSSRRYCRAFRLTESVIPAGSVF